MLLLLLLIFLITIYTVNFKEMILSSFYKYNNSYVCRNLHCKFNVHAGNYGLHFSYFTINVVNFTKMLLYKNVIWLKVVKFKQSKQDSKTIKTNTGIYNLRTLFFLNLKLHSKQAELSHTQDILFTSSGIQLLEKF